MDGTVKHAVVLASQASEHDELGQRGQCALNKVGWNASDSRGRVDLSAASGKRVERASRTEAYAHAFEQPQGFFVNQGPLSPGRVVLPSSQATACSAPFISSHRL